MSNGCREEVEEMVMFKACPRCHGDVHINSDIYGDYKECLQCGLTIDIEADRYKSALVKAVTKVRAVTKSKKKVA